jgi:predicted nucleic acid-binding protein
MSTSAPRQCVFLDACIVIYYIERNLTLFPAIEAQLFPAEGVGPCVAFSDLVRLECRVSPLRRGEHSLLARFDAFFGLPDQRNIRLTTAVFDLATELRATHRLKTPDALHLSAAIHGGCDALWTNDDRLQRAAENHLPIVVF